MVAEERYGPVVALRQGRRFLGIARPLMWVRCYAVDGVLIDAGLSSLRRQVLCFAGQQRVRSVVLTHHHEDHSGNARTLVGAGVPVYASEATRQVMRRGFAIRLYQRLIWGPAPPAEVAAVPPVLETERYRFEVLPAPGHCDDQVVLYERAQGWLFSGDVFLGERIKYFRGDEDFQQTVASLRRLAALDVESLFCAHRPVARAGRQALRRKLDYLLSLEEEVRALHARGLAAREIARQVLGAEDLFAQLLTLGDASKYNLVRSILHGPVPREAHLTQQPR